MFAQFSAIIRSTNPFGVTEISFPVPDVTAVVITLRYRRVRCGPVTLNDGGLRRGPAMPRRGEPHGAASRSPGQEEGDGGFLIGTSGHPGGEQEQ